MADPLSFVGSSVGIVQAIIDLALKIKDQVETFRHNREDCRSIGELVDTVRAVAEGLRKTTEEDGGGGALVGGALRALKQSLERAWDLVVACQRKNAVIRVLDAEGIAVKLRGVYLDVSLNLSAVVLANEAYNTSKLADINRIVAALRTDVAYNTSMLEKILEIVAALPDALRHLQQQVARLVQMCSDYSTDDYARETKKTDDVARHSTYSCYANARATTTPNATATWFSGTAFTVKEQRTAITVPEFKRWLMQFDTDDDGRISTKELREAIRRRGAWFSGLRAHFAVQRADRNGNGFVDASEIEGLIPFAERELGFRITTE